MAAYNGALNSLSSNIESKVYANDFTHEPAEYYAVKGIIYPEIEYIVPPPPIPEADYYAVKHTEIVQWIENKKFASDYTPAPPPIPEAQLNTIFINHIENPQNKAGLTDMTFHQYTNAKLSGIIFPRLYDWTGKKYGTFR
jgi:hypothetical protein